ncbi:TPA: hypothetical protein KEY88_003444 [Serratia marcescens]|nr:hypothetical protein [Serratia marcescens]
MLSELVDSAKVKFDEGYERLLSQQPVISDVIREVNKLFAEKKLVEDKISQVRGEMKHVDVNISIEVVEDADRVEELAQNIANNETKRIIVDGLKKLVEKYNVDIEILLRNNLSAYSSFLSLQKTTREYYRDYRTTMLAETISCIIYSGLKKAAISREINTGKLIELVSGHLSQNINNLLENVDGDDKDMEYLPSFECDWVDTFKSVISNDGSVSSFANGKRLAELTEIRAAM